VYCRADVELTKQLYDYGRDNKCVYFVDRFGKKKRVNVNWK
jgi:hypothetical protein